MPSEPTVAALATGSVAFARLTACGGASYGRAR